jgi:hypothetical protein
MNNCSICDSEIEEDNGDIVGNFGILPIAFCVYCYSSTVDMVYQLNGLDDIETLQEMIRELEDEKQLITEKGKNND